MTPKTRVKIENIFTILGRKDLTVVNKDAKTYMEVVDELMDKEIRPTPQAIADQWPERDEVDIMAAYEPEDSSEDLTTEEMQERAEGLTETIAEALGVDPETIRPVVYEQPSQEDMDQSMIRQIILLKKAVSTIRQETINVGNGVNSDKTLIVQGHFRTLISSLEDILSDIAFTADEALSEEYDILKFKTEWVPFVEEWEKHNLEEDDQ